MKLSIFFGGSMDVEQHIQAAERAETDGFDGIWYGQIFGPDVLTIAALAGPRTSRLSFGTSVTPTYLRHPVAMAQQALTAQASTNGRFNLGLGLSHHLVVENMWGLSYERPAVHMREYLSVLNSLLETGSASFQGEFFKVNAQAQVPAPKPLPVLIAALAPVMLKIAGTMTDGTITWMTGPKTLESHVIPRLTNAAKEAGRPAPRVVCGLPIAVWDDENEARERAARSFAIYGTLPNYQRMLEKEGASGPADVAIVGNEKAVEQQVKDLASVGVTDFVAAEFPIGDDAMASLSRTRTLLKSLIGKV